MVNKSISLIMFITLIMLNNCSTTTKTTSDTNKTTTLIQTDSKKTQKGKVIDSW